MIKNAIVKNIIKRFVHSVVLFQPMRIYYEHYWF